MFSLPIVIGNRRPRLPIILQTENAECGLACLAMIFQYYGKNASIVSLRREFSISSSGMSLGHMVKIADQHGLVCRPLKFDMDALDKLKLPAILHWNMDHFVVVKSIRPSHIVIHDPGSGIRKVSTREVSQSFTGIALELFPSQNFERDNKKDKAPSVWSFLGLSSGIVNAAIQTVLLSIFLELVAVTIPLFGKFVIDDVITNHEVNLLVMLTGIFVGLQIFKSCIGLLRSWIILFIRSNVNIQSSANLLRKLLRLRLDYFEKRQVGDIISRFNSLKTIQDELTTSFVETVIDGGMALVTLFMMTLYSIELTFMVLVCITCYLIMKYVFINPSQNATDEQINKAARSDSHLLESLRGIASIKLLGAEASRRASWFNLIISSTNAKNKVSQLKLISTAFSDLILGTSTILIFSVGAYGVLSQSLTVGMLVAFLAFKAQFADKAVALTEKLILFRLLRVHIDRVDDILISPSERYAVPGEHIPVVSAGVVKCEDLTFKYSDESYEILNEFNLLINPGELLAINGASGCGKTTLLKLLSGLLVPTKGRISIDDNDLNCIGVDKYRQSVGAVLQDDQLFNGSIAENISFFDPNADGRWIEECGKRAAIHNDIVKMPMGYNTVIGDMGSGLSGGQKQRIFIARALYRNPTILILDEATSHLDVVTERCVNDALKELTMTRIFAAHRQETLKFADRVIRIDRLSNRLKKKIA